MSEHKQLYFEKQSLSRCAVHVSNHILQKKKFTSQNFNEIAETLDENKSLFNPHKSVWGVGNYDINVLTTAMQQSGLDVVWYNSRKGWSTVKWEHVKAIVINKRTGMLMFKSRHWYCLLRSAPDKWNVLDSVQAGPGPTLTRNGALDHVNEMDARAGTQLFIVFDAKISNIYSE